jgi:hypothetical protein
MSRMSSATGAALILAIVIPISEAAAAQRLPMSRRIMRACAGGF